MGFRMVYVVLLAVIEGFSCIDRDSRMVFVRDERFCSSDGFSWRTMSYFTVEYKLIQRIRSVIGKLGKLGIHHDLFHVRGQRAQ